MDRRQFLKLGLAGTALLLIRVDSHGVKHVLAAPVPGGTLDPTALGGGVAKYETKLVIPPAMPRSGKLKGLGIKGQMDYYEIAVRQFRQKILPASFYAGLNSAEAKKGTLVWSYGSLAAQGTVAEGGTFNYPALTIEAVSGKPIQVKWVNDLTDTNGNFLPHLLPVDATIHWANPPGPIDSHYHAEAPISYDGPVPFITHVHGAIRIGEESDGYTEAWYLPQAKNLPANYYTEGSYYKAFRKLFYDKFGFTWEPGSATYRYPNDQRATTLWYHDHSLGMTRLNVYAGPAGFYLIRGGPGDQVKGRLPGPAPKLGDKPGTRYYEIPIVIQDRSFNKDGSLFFPNNRAFFEGLNEAGANDEQFPGENELNIPLIGGSQPSDIHPIWNPEFFGNTMVVNGSAWPKLEVEPRRYRFRFLNGCNSRFLRLKLVDANGFEAVLPSGDAAATVQAAASSVPVWQIGAEGGFLPGPVKINDLAGDNAGILLMGPAERADVIVDFSGLPVGTQIYLTNEGPDEPFGGGVPGDEVGGFLIADKDTTRQVMLFEVVPLVGSDTSTPPDQLGLPGDVVPLAATSNIRKVSLNEADSAFVMFEGEIFGPRAAFCGTVAEATGGAPTGVAKMWMEPVTEQPGDGDTEIWEIYNFTMDAHPIHLHQVDFEVIGRAPMADPMNQRPREPWESGPKDTVIAYPDEITRIKAKFEGAGRYVWHCHIVDHEDNEMMRPYDIGVVPALEARPTGTILASYALNTAILTYTYVGDAEVKLETVRGISGTSLVDAAKLQIETSGGTLAIGLLEGFGVNGPSSRGWIEGAESLAFALKSSAVDTAKEQTKLLDFTCAFRLQLNGKATVRAVGYRDGKVVGTWEQEVRPATRRSLYSRAYTIEFAGQQFDRIEFSATAGRYSVARLVKMNTRTASAGS